MAAAALLNQVGLSLALDCAKSGSGSRGLGSVCWPLLWVVLVRGMFPWLARDG